MKQRLKKMLTGMELEYLLIDNNGYITSQADKLILKCKKHNKNIALVKEAALSQIELLSKPNVKVKNTCLEVLENIQTLLEEGEKNDILICPFGMYPGAYKPRVRKKRWYKLQEKYFMGRKNFLRAVSTAGFHFHYTLPKGIFDWKKKFPKTLAKSKANHYLLNSYNLAIAIDPAITTLFQSSPYMDGRYISKDTRILVYRTGKSFPFQGIYAKMPKLGGLPIYKDTITDLLYVINKRYDSVKELFRRKGLNPKSIYRYGKILQYSWHSVRVNKIGTMELRSMDANYPKYISAGTVMLKFMNRAVNLYDYEVVPSDIALEEPFKIEGNKIYIPPHTHVRKKLQYLSAYEGFDSKEIYKYCRRFLKMARTFTDKDYYPAIAPLMNLHKRKMTVSDMIIRKFKKKGYNLKDKIPADVCAEVTLESTRKLMKEIDTTKKTVEGLDL